MKSLRVYASGPLHSTPIMTPALPLATPPGFTWASSIEPGIIQRHDLKNQGNSFSATVDVGKKKGYVLVCHTGNCIFLRDDLKNKINYQENSLNNPNILFDRSWLNKKDNILKRIFLKLMPVSMIEFLRKIKRLIISKNDFDKK